ncbi:hypothetical protein D3C78_1346240 [compost metagenome]
MDGKRNSVFLSQIKYLLMQLRRIPVLRSGQIYCNYSASHKTGSRLNNLQVIVRNMVSHTDNYTSSLNTIRCLASIEAGDKCFYHLIQAKAFLKVKSCPHSYFYVFAIMLRCLLYNLISRSLD